MDSSDVRDDHDYYHDADSDRGDLRDDDYIYDAGDDLRDLRDDDYFYHADDYEIGVSDYIDDADNDETESRDDEYYDYYYQDSIKDCSDFKKKRKLRQCPKRHLSNAENLAAPSDEVAVVGRYRYFQENPIGRGAFSQVFVAIRDEDADSASDVIQCRAYALKRIDKAKINPREIEREINILLRISGKCENVINYHDAVKDAFFHYLCLDLMDGDLHELVKNDVVVSCLYENIFLFVQLCKQVIVGLEFLHKEGCIHRDIKPGNILYTTDPFLQLKIADFGLTKDTASSMTSTGGINHAMIPGTRCWLSPELVSLESGKHTRQSDIFSLGLVLHYLLSLGKHPFEKPGEVVEPLHVTEQNIQNMKLYLDKSLHPEAANFLQLTLAKDPSDRPLAENLRRHLYLWPQNKKIEFLKAVGDQPEAEKPAKHPNSDLEQSLQNTTTGKEIIKYPWNGALKKLCEEMTKHSKRKYRKNNLLDLTRFIRNACAHNQEKSEQFKKDLENHIFLREFPLLVLDVFDVVQKLKLHETRDNIRQVLEARSETQRSMEII